MSAIGGDAGAANDLRSIAAPQFRVRSVRPLPDAFAGAGRRDVDKIIRPKPGRERASGRQGDSSREASSALESPIRIRQRVLFGLARVTTRRLPSAVAASDVYRSGPKVSR